MMVGSFAVLVQSLTVRTSNCRVCGTYLAVVVQSVCAVVVYIFNSTLTKMFNLWFKNVSISWRLQIAVCILHLAVCSLQRATCRVEVRLAVCSLQFAVSSSICSVSSSSLFVLC